MSKKLIMFVLFFNICADDMATDVFVEMAKSDQQISDKFADEKYNINVKSKTLPVYSQDVMQPVDYVTLVNPDLAITQTGEDSLMEEATRQVAADGLIELDEIDTGSALSVF